MHWIDWLITLLPLTFILGFAFYSHYYVHGVADYLAAGRVAGRYVISVSGMETSLGVITLVALVEIRYQTGYAFGFWENLAAPVGIIMALTGFCVYRFRETRALSIGQFLEMLGVELFLQRILCALVAKPQGIDDMDRDFAGIASCHILCPPKQALRDGS